MLVVLLIAITSIAVGSTLAKYASENEVGGFDLKIEPQEQVYAVYSATDNSLDFYYGVYPEKNTILANGNAVTKVYRNNIATSTASTPEWQDVATSVKSVNFDDSISSVSPVSTMNWFSDFKNVLSIDLTNLNTTHTTNMSGMFDGCLSLETLKLGENFGSAIEENLNDEYTGLKTVALDWVKDGSATEISANQVLVSGAGVYEAKVLYCYATLANQTLYIYQRRYVPAVGEQYDDGVNASYKVGGVYSWRNGTTSSSYTTCEGGRPPKDADGNVRSSWNVLKSDAVFYIKVVDDAQPKSCNSWFRSFQNLGYQKENNPLDIVDLRKLDTSNATGMQYMFYDCNKLTTLDFTKYEMFDTSKVTNMSCMFSKCFYIQTLNLSNFDTSSVTNMDKMFDMTSSTGLVSFLKTIVVSDTFVVGTNTTASGMFSKCAILMGGAGTEFTASGKQYAIVDGGTDNPGYFTAVAQACTCETKCTTEKNHDCPRCNIEHSAGYNYCKHYIIPPTYPNQEQYS